MKLNRQGREAYKLVERLLLARRNQNIRAEQAAHEALRAWCLEQGADMDGVIQQIKGYMLEHRVAPAMNGLV